MTMTHLRQKVNELFFVKNIKLPIYIVLLAVLVLFRMFIAYNQRVFLLPEGSGIDDMLMIRAAQSITDGDWLGGYGAFAMAKNMGFAVWVAICHTLHIPILLANAALWLAACGFATYALRPLFKGNVGRLVVFALFAYQPFSYAFFTQRVYRDSIFPAFSLLFFAGIVGIGLRLFATNERGILFSAIVSGIGFAGAWLCREDGVVLLVFAICAVIVLLVLFLLQKPHEKVIYKIVCLAMPFIILLGGIVGFSAMNYAHYGVFMVSDMTQGAFQGAYGAMVAVSQAEIGHTRYVPVTNQALEKMYAQVPLLAQLQPSLDSSTVRNGFSDDVTGEFGGSFYFALRYGADLAGYTSTAPEAQEYWRELERQINVAVEEGRLASVKPFASTVPRWDNSLLNPTLHSMRSYFLTLFTFKDTHSPASIKPLESIGPADKVQDVANYLYSTPQVGYKEGTTELYYNLPQRFCFAICEIITWVYRVLLWILFVLALAITIGSVVVSIKGLAKKQANATKRLALTAVAIGLLFSVFLRVVVCAYLEVASFNIGIYLMYVSGAMPPLMLFLFLGIALPQIKIEKDNKIDLQSSEKEE